MVLNTSHRNKHNHSTSHGMQHAARGSCTFQVFFIFCIYAVCNDYYMLLTRKLAHTFSDIPPETSYIPTESKVYQPVITLIYIKACPHGCVQSGLNRFCRIRTDHRIRIKPAPRKPPHVVVSNQFVSHDVTIMLGSIPSRDFLLVEPVRFGTMRTHHEQDSIRIDPDNKIVWTSL